MTHSRNEARLCEPWSEVADVDAASEILGWDRETCMPEKGRVERATGKPLSSERFLDYIRSTTEEVHGVRV